MAVLAAATTSSSGPATRTGRSGHAAEPAVAQPAVERAGAAADRPVVDDYTTGYRFYRPAIVQELLGTSRSTAGTSTCRRPSRTCCAPGTRSARSRSASATASAASATQRSARSGRRCAGSSPSPSRTASDDADVRAATVQGRQPAHRSSCCWSLHGRLRSCRCRRYRSWRRGALDLHNVHIFEQCAARPVALSRRRGASAATQWNRPFYYPPFLFAFFRLDCGR